MTDETAAPVPAAGVAPVVAVAPAAPAEGVVAKVEAEVKAEVAKAVDEAEAAWSWIKKNAVAIKNKMELFI